VRQWQAGTILTVVLTVGCSDSSGPATLTLDDLTDPDPNTAVVVVDRDIVEGSDTVKGGVEEMYLVETGAAWDVVTANLGVKQLTFIVPDAYAADPYLADPTTFRWIDPTGRQYYPVVKCVVTVSSAFVLATPSTLWLETECEVSPPEGGASFKVLIKARRFGTPEEGP